MRHRGIKTPRPTLRHSCRLGIGSPAGAYDDLAALEYR